MPNELIEILKHSLFFIVMFYFWINYLGYKRLSDSEWKMIKSKRLIRDLEPTTWD